MAFFRMQKAQFLGIVGLIVQILIVYFGSLSIWLQQPVSGTVSFANLGCLLESEKVIVEVELVKMIFFFVLIRFFPRGIVTISGY